jgi:predicted Na+-dependent transporter
MNETSKSLKRFLGIPFWIGYVVSPILLFILLSALGCFGDGLSIGLFVCIALGVVGPVGGLFFQAIHDLFVARRLHLLRIWDFSLIVAIVAAFVVAGYVAFHTSGASHAVWFAGAFVYVLVWIYARRRRA